MYRWLRTLHPSMIHPSRLSELSAAQLSYVATWAAYLASHGCPCIGVMAQEEAA